MRDNCGLAALDRVPDRVQQRVVAECFVKNSTAPAFMACTLIGTSP